jgi:hypothetical protein
MRIIRHRDGWQFQSNGPPNKSKGESEGSIEEYITQRNETYLKKIKGKGL